MCDCYEQKCLDLYCGQLIPIHIGDYCTLRENLEVLCSRHLPKNLEEFDGAVWKWFHREWSYQTYLPKGFKIGIRVLDKSQVKEWGRSWNYYKDYIHPNSTYYEKIKDW